MTRPGEKKGKEKNGEGASLASCSLGRPMPRPPGAWRGFGCHAIRPPLPLAGLAA